VIGAGVKEEKKKKKKKQPKKKKKKKKKKNQQLTTQLAPCLEHPLHTPAGVPLGRLVDAQPHRRVRILALGLFLWSLATLLSGLVHGYVALLLLRVVVGLGQSVGNPACLGVIAEVFGAGTPECSAATGVYSMGVYLGSGLAAGIGGAVGGDSQRWRSGLAGAGGAGIAIAALLLATVPERGGIAGGARRRGHGHGPASGSSQLSRPRVGSTTSSMASTEPLLSAAGTPSTKHNSTTKHNNTTKAASSARANAAAAGHSGSALRDMSSPPEDHTSEMVLVDTGLGTVGALSIANNDGDQIGHDATTASAGGGGAAAGAAVSDGSGRKIRRSTGDDDDDDDDPSRLPMAMREAGEIIRVGGGEAQHQSQPEPPHAAERVSLVDVAKYLFTLEAWRLTLAGGVRTTGGVVLNAFMPGLLKDLFPEHAVQVNFYYGGIIMIVGALSAFLGGFATRTLLGRGWSRAGTLVPAVGACVAAPFVLLIAIVGGCGRAAGPNGTYPETIGMTSGGVAEAHVSKCFAGSLFLVLGAILAGEVWVGPTVAIVVSVLPARIKGLGLAIYFAILTLASSLGPALTGVILTRIDHWHRRFVVTGIVSACYTVSAFLFVWYARHQPSDMERRIACERDGEFHITLSRTRKRVVLAAATAIVIATITIVTLAFVNQ
jgi:MFS family permease